MNPANDRNHLDAVTLVKFHLGRLADLHHEAVERHLAICRTCSARLAASKHSFNDCLTVELSRDGSLITGAEPEGLLKTPLPDLTAEELDADLPFAAEIEE